MPAGVASYALLGALATALLAAAVSDLRRREIGNRLNAGIAVAAPLFWLVSGLGWSGVAVQVGLALATFLLGCLLFAARQMGGGDVKLLTALALWFVPASFGQLLAIMVMIGGGASVALAVFNMRRVSGDQWRDRVAVGAAALWVTATCVIVYGVATGRPLLDADAASVIWIVVPGGWWLVLGAMLLCGFILFGMRHIFRRQAAHIAMPYGVAIAAAGLWVMAQDTVAPALASLRQA